MDDPERDMAKLELELLRKGMDELAACLQRCARCRRTPLVGERVYAYASGVTLCELCRALEPGRPHSSALVHGPEYGHTMRIRDHRQAA